MASHHPPNIAGTWKMVSRSDNFEDYLKKLDVNLIIRKIVLTTHSVMEIQHNKQDDSYHVKTSTGPKSKDFSFKFDAPFEEVTLDGRHCKSKMILGPSGKEGEINLLHEQNWKDNKKGTITYEFRGDSVTLTFKFEDVSVSQVLKREHGK